MHMTDYELTCAQPLDSQSQKNGLFPERVGSGMTGMTEMTGMTDPDRDTMHIGVDMHQVFPQ